MIAATLRMAGIGATLSFPRVPAKVPSPSDLPTFVIAVCHHGESHKQHADAAISMAETRTPPIGGVLSLAGVRPLGRRLGHRQQGNRAQRFQRLQDLGCLRQESLSAGAAARRKRPSSTTPTGRSASSSAANGTAAIGSSIWCAARVNPGASGRPSESKQLCDVESGLTSTGLLLQRGCQERGLL